MLYQCQGKLAQHPDLRTDEEFEVWKEGCEGQCETKESFLWDVYILVM